VQLLMAALADRSELVDGKANLMGLFQSIVAAHFPTVLHGVLAIRVAVDADEAEWVEVAATLRHAGEEYGEISVAAFVPPATAGQPLRGIDVTIDLEGTELPEPGLYTFEVAVGGEHVASVPLSALATASPGRA
jgi:hypothetical protein